MSEITYTQKIFAVDILPEAEGLSNVVARVKWEYRARDGVHVAWTMHITDLELPSEESFVSFDEITESMVLEWINAQVDIEPLKAELNAQLEATRTDLLEKDPPWEVPGDNVFSREYVLLHQGEVIWGPSGWNTGAINNALADAGLTVALPNVVAIIPETQPLVIGTDTTLYRVKTEGPFRPVLIDSVIYDVGDWVWDYSTGIAVRHIEHNVKSIEDLRASVIHWLRVQRFLGYYKPQDPLAFEYMTQLTKMMFYFQSASDPIDWLNVDDLTISSISKADFQTMIETSVVEQKALDTVANTRADAVRNATTTEEIIGLYTTWLEELE